MSQNNFQKGVSIYLAVAMMAILMSVAMGISTIFLGQVKATRGLGYSVIAFYAADAGIERILLNRSSPTDISETSLSNGAIYRVIVSSGGSDDCTAPNYCIKSVGSYKETNRAIEISY